MGHLVRLAGLLAEWVAPPWKRAHHPPETQQALQGVACFGGGLTLELGRIEDDNSFGHRLESACIFREEAPLGGFRLKEAPSISILVLGGRVKQRWTGTTR